MGSAFSQSDAQLAKYWYERRIYTWGPQNLPTEAELGDPAAWIRRVMVVPAGPAPSDG